MRTAALLVILSVSKFLCYNLVVAVDHPEDFVNLLAGMIWHVNVVTVYDHFILPSLQILTSLGGGRYFACKHSLAQLISAAKPLPWILSCVRVVLIDHSGYWFTVPSTRTRIVCISIYSTIEQNCAFEQSFCAFPIHSSRSLLCFCFCSLGSFTDGNHFSTGNTLPLVGRPWGFNHWFVLAP